MYNKQLMWDIKINIKNNSKNDIILNRNKPSRNNDNIKEIF